MPIEIFSNYTKNANIYQDAKWSLDIPNLITSNENRNLISYIKPKYLRLNLRYRWADIEPTRGNYKWNAAYQMDNPSTCLCDEMGVLEQNGVLPLMVVKDNPIWASVDGSKYTGISDAYLQDFYTFGQKSQYQYPKVNNWEVWNEPDVPRELSNKYYGGWGNTVADGARYGKALSAFSDGVKSVNSSAVIWSGGLMANKSRDCNNFLDGFLPTAKGKFDVFAIHGHQDSHYKGGTVYTPSYDERTDWYWDGIYNKILWFQSKLDLYGVKSPISINEAAKICSDEWNIPKWGTCDTSDARFETDQLIYAGVLSAMSNIFGLHSIFWYHDYWGGASLIKNGNYSKVAQFIHGENN